MNPEHVMKKCYRVLLALIFILVAPPTLSGQTYSLKTNLLYFTAGMTPNLSFEAAVAPRWTIDVGGSYNPWRLSSEQENKKLQHWFARAEARCWLYETFDGHFFSLTSHYGRYNAGGVKLPFNIYPELKEHRFEGYALGLSVGYGYQWYAGPHWNIEASLGLGYSYMDYKKFECARCGRHISNGNKHYFGPTKINVSLVYLFKTKKHPR